jgi:hypothetical protein
MRASAACVLWLLATGDGGPSLSDMRWLFIRCRSAACVQGDVARAISDAINKRGGSASTQITVVKPSSLNVVSTSLDATGFDCFADFGLNCRSYLRLITYVIRDQFGDTFGPWSFFANETFADFSSSCAGVNSPPRPTSEPISGTMLPDGFSLCTVSCPQCNPTASGCTVRATQTWFINGFPVRRNNITWTCSDAAVQQTP